MIASESSNDSSSSGEDSNDAQNSAFSAAKQNSSSRVVQKNRGRQMILKKKPAAEESANDSLAAENPEVNVSEISRVKTRSQMKKKQNRSEIIQPADVPGLFMIDRNPNASEPATTSSSSVLRTFPRKGGEFSKKNQKSIEENFRLSSELDAGVNLDDLYLTLDPVKNWKNEEEKKLQKVPEKTSTRKLDEIMKKSVWNENFDKLDPFTLKDLYKGKRAQKRERKTEREKTSGADWFNLPATEMTEERRRDLEILQMRDALDPKRHYKSNDRTVLPKYFQIGTVIEHPSDFYSSRLTKKERKRTLVDEFLADADARNYHRKKYQEIMAEKFRAKKGASSKFRHRKSNQKISKKKRRKIAK